MFDWRAFDGFLGRACDHYEKSAPTVHAYCDELCRRLQDDADGVCVSEVIAVLALRQDSEWEQPNYAANRIYKLMSRLGMDTTGHAGF